MVMSLAVCYGLLSRLTRSLNDAIDKAVEPACTSPLSLATTTGMPVPAPPLLRRPLLPALSYWMIDRAYFSNHSQRVDIFAPSEHLDLVW